MEDWEGVVNFYFALSRNYFIHKYLILISIFWDNTKFTEFEIIAIEEFEFSMDYFSAPPPPRPHYHEQKNSSHSV